MILGLVGTPGAGKSHLAAALVCLIGPTAIRVPMDGFHLADVELARLGLLDKKGAPETFDPSGYASLLERLRSRSRQPLLAPGFDRDAEQPIADSITVGPDIDVVVSEGNYLLLDRPEWRRARAQFDEVWYVATDEELRRERLVARHIEFGKSPAAATEWVRRVDEPNARLVEDSRDGADKVIDLTGWES